MKKLNLLLAIILISVTTIFRAGAQDYIVTDDDVKYYDKVRYGLTSGLVGINETGRVKYRDNEVVSFRKDARIYERMPVYENNNETGKYAFMELVAYRNGLKVFRNYCKVQMQDEFIVYRNESLMVKFDERNSDTLNEFFFRSRNLLAGK